MKRISFSLLMLMISFVGVFAQINEGKIKVEITDVKSDNEQLAMQLEMMKGSETEYYFQGDKYVTKMNMMGGMMVIENYIDTKTEKMDMLMNVMGQKMWIDSDMKEAKEQGGKITNEDVNIVYDKNDKKTIQGLESYKFSLTIPNPQMPMEVSGYLTEEIKSEGNLVQGLENVKLVGFPLEFSVKNKMMTITMEATEVEKSVDKEVFVLKTDGYKKMTMEEFQAAMGSMGGGMGF